ALDEKEKGNEVVLVTDDYSIQNVAMALGIEFESVIHPRISKGFKWVRICRGCGRKVESDVCPICGGETVIRKVKK
ncbi:MAG: ribonuclease VapC, partial [Archaeoglobaceae archaeon]